MASKEQIVANQANARKSTGPRSKAGKRVSSRNALRHGLAISIASDLAYRDDIEKLATVLSSSKNAQKREAAREAAEAALDLYRISKIRAVLFDKAHSNGRFDLARFVELSANLARLERYERRAFSRRGRALRALGFDVLASNNQ